MCTAIKKFKIIKTKYLKEKKYFIESISLLYLSKNGMPIIDNTFDCSLLNLLFLTLIELIGLSARNENNGNINFNVWREIHFNQKVQHKQPNDYNSQRTHLSIETESSIFEYHLLKRFILRQGLFIS